MTDLHDENEAAADDRQRPPGSGVDMLAPPHDWCNQSDCAQAHDDDAENLGFVMSTFCSLLLKMVAQALRLDPTATYCIPEARQ
jgi:hypothetical protein